MSPRCPWPARGRTRHCRAGAMHRGSRVVGAIIGGLQDGTSASDVSAADAAATMPTPWGVEGMGSDVTVQAAPRWRTLPRGGPAGRTHRHRGDTRRRGPEGIVPGPEGDDRRDGPGRHDPAGTKTGPDVIAAALGGTDVIDGRGGNDLICGPPVPAPIPATRTPGQDLAPPVSCRPHRHRRPVQA